jgi:nucleoside-diphosphate-sugar epimerase
MTMLPTLAQACALDERAVEVLRAGSRRIIVVGAGGWIGRALLRGLHDALGAAAFAVRVAAFGSSARAIDLGDGLSAMQRPLSEVGALPAEPSLLFNLAFLTKDKVAGMPRDEYIAANRALTQTVLGALAPVGVDRLFLASSGAAAFAEDPDASDDLRLYGALKRDDENIFAAWAAEDPERRAVVTRIYSLSGPFINKHEVYALASFINAALSGEPIAVCAPMPVLRSYVAIRELMSLVLVQLLGDEGEQVRRYDSGGDALELAEFGALVARVLGGEVQRAEITRDQPNRYVGAAEPYARLLDEAGIAPVVLEQQIADTAVTLAAK